METRCQRKACGGELVKINGPSYKCKSCGKLVYFSLRARMRNGEQVELIKLPKGGVAALRSLIHTNPGVTFKTVRHGLIAVADLDTESLPERS